MDFGAGTFVLTTLGYAGNECIRAGDYVYAKDEETGEQEYMPVLDTFTNEVTEICTLTIDGETIETTVGHKFYTVENGWMSAGDLSEGDTVELSDGSSGTVESVEITELDEPVTVYNFCVMDFHTYYVGENEVLVHNKPCNTSKTVESSGSTTSDVNWTDHGHKHFPNKNTSWKDTVKSTKNGPAKYSPDIDDIETFERNAWDTGTNVTNGKNWKVKAYDDIIGAASGKETKYVRIENSANTIHGHPISETEYNKLLR